MAQSNDDLPFDLSLLEGELQQEEAPDPLDLIDDCDQSEVVPEELLQEALRQLQGSQEEQLQGLKVFCEHRDPRSQPLLRPQQRLAAGIAMLTEHLEPLELLFLAALQLTQGFLQQLFWHNLGLIAVIDQIKGIRSLLLLQFPLKKRQIKRQIVVALGHGSTHGSRSGHVPRQPDARTHSKQGEGEHQQDGGRQQLGAKKRHNEIKRSTILGPNRGCRLSPVTP